MAKSVPPGFSHKLGKAAFVPPALCLSDRAQKTVCGFQAWLYVIAQGFSVPPWKVWVMVMPGWPRAVVRQK